MGHPAGPLASFSRDSTTELAQTFIPPLHFMSASPSLVPSMSSSPWHDAIRAGAGHCGSEPTLRTMMTESIESIERAIQAGHPDAMVRYIELMQCGVIRAKACKCKPARGLSMRNICTCNEQDSECERLTRQLAASIRANDDVALKMSDKAKFMFSLLIEYHMDDTNEKMQARAFRRRISEDACGPILSWRGADLWDKAEEQNNSKTKKSFFSLAHEYFLRGAADDDADCFVYLAHMYAHGLGVSKAPKFALKFDIYAAELHHPIAMLELALYYSGNDADNRHGLAPKEEVNLALSYEYFARIRSHQINSRAFAWHPLIRDYLKKDIKRAKRDMLEFEQSHPAIVQAAAMAAARVGSQSQQMSQSQLLQPSAFIKPSSSPSASIAQDDAVPSASKKRRLDVAQGVATK